MPIAKCRGRTLYFAHIPKCGGASVENYLARVTGGGIAFLDNNYRLNPRNRRWAATPPQHIYGEALSYLFPASFFDSFLAVVRNPISRFVSAFWFQKRVEKQIDQNVGINEFVSQLDRRSITSVGYMDGHFMPQSLFFYPGVEFRIFRLEEGLGPVKNYIDNFFFGNALALEMPHLNAKRLSENAVEEELSTESTEILTELYHDDFRLLGYAPVLDKIV